MRLEGIHNSFQFVSIVPLVIDYILNFMGKGRSKASEGQSDACRPGVISEDTGGVLCGYFNRCSSGFDQNESPCGECDLF